jgi:SAM-dependent methyltransferase
MRSPKRDSSNRHGRAQWYPYYAGYAPGFVEDAIAYGKQLDSYQRILDPWNGSGTTTQIAAEHGLSATGYDLNPVMVIVARARLVDVNVLPSIASLLDDICAKTKAFVGTRSTDPLSLWLSATSARAFRAIDYAISVLLIDATQPFIGSHLEKIDSISSLASYFYVALFRALRSFLKGFEGSNPTWIKDAKHEQAKLKLTSAKVIATFRKEVCLMCQGAGGNSPVKAPTHGRIGTSVVQMARSTHLPSDENAFDLVISSPPYCTRIDYVVKTKPELAVLGYDEAKLRLLRSDMLGTPTIQSLERSQSKMWGPSCDQVLTRIGEHPSRASLSYYWKTYVQYFDGLFKSIEEIGRALTPSGLSFLVVQDSYYKNIHVDLACIADEMAVKVGFEIENRFDFPASRSMAGLNSAARGYQERHKHVESILVWRKAS